jgi:hypothetical protein
MKKVFAILAVTMMVAGATTTAATARSYHHYRYHHHYGWMGFRSSNAELRGNNANSAWGRNSLANPNVAAGIGK